MDKIRRIIPAPPVAVLSADFSLAESPDIQRWPVGLWELRQGLRLLGADEKCIGQRLSWATSSAHRFDESSGWETAQFSFSFPVAAARDGDL